MKFKIDRASHSSNETKPVPEAYRDKYVLIDQRGFATAEDYDSRFRCKWSSDGYGHGTNEKGIFRLFDEEDWFVDVDDLLAFHGKHGELILREFYSNPAILRITIYDDYVE